MTDEAKDDTGEPIRLFSSIELIEQYVGIDGDERNHPTQHARNPDDRRR